MRYDSLHERVTKLAENRQVFWTSAFPVFKHKMVKKSKGLSFDEKKSALSSAMMQGGSFYNMKELELLAKKHGVVPQSVKEVVDCLIGDRVIIQEKIGSLNMYE